MKYYKFLNESNGKIVSEHGHQVWEVGEEYSVKGYIQACSNGFHASVQPLDALGYVKGSIVAIVEASGDCDNDDDKVCYRSMRIVRAYKWTANDSIKLAIYAAEQVIKIYEAKYPNDSRPRDAIKAAKAYLKNPTKDAADAAADAAYADAARAAAYAARAAAYAAYADAAYADAAADAARAAAYAARAAAYAAYAARAELKEKVNRWMKRHIKTLEEIK